jgi:hypothetical protein
MSFFLWEAFMSSAYIFKKGDLIGINERDHVYGYVIAQVVRENRFFYCYCLETHAYHFLVFDQKFHFLWCPDFDPDIQPDIDILSMGVEFYDALDRLFGFANDFEEPSE